jgi:hypothetical protein
MLSRPIEDLHDGHLIKNIIYITTPPKPKNGSNDNIKYSFSRGRNSVKEKASQKIKPIILARNNFFDIKFFIVIS